MGNRCSMQQSEESNCWLEQSPENRLYRLFRSFWATRYFSIGLGVHEILQVIPAKIIYERRKRGGGTLLEICPTFSRVFRISCPNLAEICPNSYICKMGGGGGAHAPCPPPPPPFFYAYARLSPPILLDRLQTGTGTHYRRPIFPPPPSCCCCLLAIIFDYCSQFRPFELLLLLFFFCFYKHNTVDIFPLS